ncbi:MAG: nucleoside monophosphate kinase [Patescibacteria group bacterium]
MRYKKVLNLLFLGPQGSGKGTQAKILAEKMRMRHLSSGEVLRQTAKTSTPLGKYLRRQLRTGTLTPVAKLLQVFEQYIKKIPAATGLALDGFARQISETRILLRRLAKLGRPIDLVIFIDIGERETLKRLSLRGQCDKCNRIFILGGKLAIGGKCPACGGRIFQREDDTPEAIKKRLAMYRRRTLPVIRFFQSQKLLIKIRGEQSVERVYRDIVQVLKRRGLIAKA